MRFLTVGKAVMRRASDGKYLMLRSSAWEQRPDRSQKPDLPGGVVEAGETPEIGCGREIKEETGISVDPSSLQLVHAHTFRSSKDGASINRLIYFIELKEEVEVTLSWEHESFEWMSASQVLDLGIRQPYQEIFKYLNGVGVLV